MSDTPEKVDRVEEISEERVRHIALLSRLELSDDEIKAASRDLTNILHHINKLGELDLDDVPMTSHAIPVADVFRDDVLRSSLTNEEAIANAPEKEENCFKVPQII